MNSEQALIELLDNYAKGKLNAQEIAAVEERIKNDADFRQKAEQHLALIDNLKFYGSRNDLHNTLNGIHDDLEDAEKIIPLSKPTTTHWKRYWPMTAVAASVAIISILGTLYVTRLETQQTAVY